MNIIFLLTIYHSLFFLKKCSLDRYISCVLIGHFKIEKIVKLKYRSIRCLKIKF